MKLYSYKNLDCGFVILCPDHAVKLLLSTANSIKRRYPGRPYICVTDNTANIADIKEMKEICPTYKGKDSFTSLINIGMKKAPAEWNFLICAGATMRYKLDQRFSYFVDSNKDILFPISEGRYTFTDCSLNGIFFHKNVFKDIGKMSDEGDLEMVKTIWALTAIGKGYKFKAIANSKII